MLKIGHEFSIRFEKLDNKQYAVRLNNVALTHKDAMNEIWQKFEEYMRRVLPSDDFDPAEWHIVDIMLSNY